MTEQEYNELKAIVEGAPKLKDGAIASIAYERHIGRRLSDVQTMVQQQERIQELEQDKAVLKNVLLSSKQCLGDSYPSMQKMIDKALEQFK